MVLAGLLDVARGSRDRVASPTLGVCGLSALSPPKRSSRADSPVPVFTTSCTGPEARLPADPTYGGASTLDVISRQKSKAVTYKLVKCVCVKQKIISYMSGTLRFPSLFYFT